MPRSLPLRPDLQQLRIQAKGLLRAQRQGDPSSCGTFRLLPRLADAPDEAIMASRLCLADAQHALAVDYGFRNWQELRTRVEECPPPLRNASSERWYHGSPMRLQSLRPGSSVTPVVELARAFARRPSRIDIRVHEDTDENVRNVTLEDDGKQKGHVFEVEVSDPATDLRENPDSRMAPGEELLTTRELRVRLLEEVPVAADSVQQITEEAF